ncbi:MAG: glycosyltransferase family 2 protein [Planctomycetia bacterium]|jgi:dolichol-phosphate mannosyltransferase
MLSIVIPVYNEEESLEELHRQIDAVGQDHGYDLDFVFIDDGSKDSSWNVLKKLSEADPRVRAIRFRRNFGKAAALNAGFAAARGELIMTLDADLQDDPAEIPRFLEKMEQDLDVVSGYKQVRHDPWHKVGPSRVFNWMVSRLTGVHLHDHNCGMKCYRREIFDEVRLYGELHRFVPVLAAARGYRVGEIVIQHRARQFGVSKYGVTRIVKGFLDLLSVKFVTGFGQRPQHLLGTIGLGAFLLGALGMIYLAGYWVVTQFAPDTWGMIPLHQRPAVIYSVGLMLFGGQLMSIGFVSELILAYHKDEIRPFSISEKAGFEED